MLPNHCVRVARACLQRQLIIPGPLTPSITAARSRLLRPTPLATLQFEQLRFAVRRTMKSTVLCHTYPTEH
jgi:hypothetical protein